MEQILEWDYQIFDLINNKFQNGFLDLVLPLWRSKYIWFPLYVFLVFFLADIFKKKIWYVLIGVAVLVTVSDTMSSQIIKKSIKRSRPCRTEIIKEQVHLLVPCSTGYSFTSSHATNHFALAMFLFVLLSPTYRALRRGMLFWAASISFGQVYVGVHFPIDVTVGAALGSLIGWLIGHIIKKGLTL